MAINVRMYKNMAKRVNSTKQPSSELYTDTTAVLKEGESFMAPVLLVNMKSTDTARLSYNYLRAELGEGDLTYHYYFVNDITPVGTDLFELACELDVLATYKTDIGSETKYVLRSASSYTSTITDTLYPGKASSLRINAVGGRIWATDTPSLVLGIVGKPQSSATAGAVNYYALTPAQALALFTWLNGTPISTAIGTPPDNILDFVKWFFGIAATTYEDIENAIQIYLSNPIQNIVSARWYPFTPSGTGSSPIYYGPWTVPDITATLLPAHPTLSRTGSAISIPKHPDASTRGNYLNAAPFANYELYIEPFGRFTLSGAELDNYTGLVPKVITDITTGETLLEVEGLISGVGQKIFQSWGEIGIEIPLAAKQINVAGSVLSASGAVVSASTGNVLGSLGGIFSSIENALPTIETKGSTRGNMIAYQHAGAYPVLSGVFRLPADEDNADFGRPLCKTVALNTLSGYIQCRDGHNDIATVKAAKDKIEEYLVNGFFYE